MNKYLIKICGIKSATMATQVVKAGANYIGIIFHPESPRFVTPGEAIKIAEATYSAGGIPVAVFVNQNHKDMQAICEATNIKSVQLHGEIARSHHHFLPADYQRIYVLTEADLCDKNLNADRDLILIEHAPSEFTYTLPFPWLLAGGLTPTNVETAIQTFQPFGVDVSSGVESSIGNKDIQLIQKFITAVGSGRHDAA